MKARIYGKVLNTWYANPSSERKVIVQQEIEYRDYDTETGKIVGSGSEDFSPERRKTDTEERWAFTWDGSKRNSGGYRWFTDQGLYRYRKSDKKAVIELIKNREHAELVQLRA